MKIQHLILTATTALMASNAYSATTYTYNADGRVIEENYGDDKYTYTYDGNGNRTSLTYYSCSNGSCSTTPDWKNEYTYDGNNMTSQTMYSCSVGSCTPYNKYEYAYSQTDDGGTEITFKWYDCAEDPCTLNETFVGQIKDKYGNLIYDWDNDYIYQYTYDKYGNILSRKSMVCGDYDDNQSAAEFCMNMRATTDWEDANTTTYLYDPEFIKKQWLEHRKLIYTIEEAQARVKEIGKDHVTFRIRYK